MKKIIKFLFKSILAIFIFINIVIAFHAYKFTHFYDTGDVTIKDQKDKSGLDITKEILFGINAEKQKNSNPDTAYQTVILTTQDSIKLEGWYIPVKNANGTVCIFHGHGSKKSGTNDEAAAFRKMGYNTFQLDFRAHGNSGGNACTVGYYEAEDVALTYNYIKQKGEKNIILWGISMGASTIVTAMYKYNDVQPQKIILEMPFGTLLKASEGRIKMMQLPTEPASAMLTFWGGIEHGFWAFNFKPEDYAKKINCPTLIQWGKSDPRVTKNEEETLLANLNTKNKEFVIYDSCAHESLCKKESIKWSQTVNTFLK